MVIHYKSIALRSSVPSMRVQILMFLLDCPVISTKFCVADSESCALGEYRPAISRSYVFHSFKNVIMTPFLQGSHLIGCSSSQYETESPHGTKNKPKRTAATADGVSNKNTKMCTKLLKNKKFARAANQQLCSQENEHSCEHRGTG